MLNGLCRSCFYFANGLHTVCVKLLVLLQFWAVAHIQPCQIMRQVYPSHASALQSEPPGLTISQLIGL